MSRAQQGEVYDTAKENSAKSTDAATASQQKEQEDINSNESQLAKFAANNPYVEGGQAESIENRQLSNTADATAQAAREKGQMQAERTGQNATAAIAAGEAEQQAAQRALAGQEAGATESRLAAGAKYGRDVLSAGDELTAEQARLSSNLTNEAQGQQSVAADAAKQPSFMDELGSGLINGASNSFKFTKAV